MKLKLIFPAIVLTVLLLFNTAIPSVFAETASTLTMSGATQPSTTHMQGQLFDCRGVITSNYDITSVTVGVFNSSGAMVTGGTAYPNATSFNIIKLDLQVKFRELPPGSYVYQVDAIDASGTRITPVSKGFTVVSPNAPEPSTLSISGATQPPSQHTQGQLFDCRGVVSSNYDLTYVTAYVYNSSGGTVTGGFAVPNVKSYDIIKLDTQIKFRELPAGSYLYKVTATDASGLTKTLVDRSFTVVAPTQPIQPTASTLSISGATQPPSQHTQGQLFDCRGVISSNYDITSVTAAVYNSSGGMVTGGSAAPYATSYNIIKLDTQIKFKELPMGSYTYTVTGSDASGTSKTLVSKSFTVVPTDQQIEPVPVSPEMNAQFSGFSMPTTIAYGKPFYVTSGIISSTSPITYVQVKVINSAGQNEMPTAYASCNTTNFTFASLDSKLTFRLLKKGTYRFEVWATTNSEAQKVYDSTFEVAAPTSIAVTGLDNLINPLKGANFRISQKWGTPNDTKFHRGIDLAIATGTPVYAAESGTIHLIRKNGEFGTYGNLIVIKHNNGTFYTAYAHLNGFANSSNSTNITDKNVISIKEGTWVSQGQLIGYVGNTGANSTGSHLHFEINPNWYGVEFTSMNNPPTVDPGLYI